MRRLYGKRNSSDNSGGIKTLLVFRGPRARGLETKALGVVSETVIPFLNVMVKTRRSRGR